MSKLLEQINRESKPYFVGDLADIKYGFGLPEPKRIKGSIPVYASSGVVGYHNEAKVDKPAIIIGRKGNVGSLYFSQQPSFPIDTAFFIDEPKEGFDLKYIFYLLKRINLPRYGGDSAVPGLSRDTVYGLQVETPKLETQKKIAEILSAYDAKIENNNKIIKNLEAAAQIIFNEWFVNFKFPGYKKVKMVESEMGEIPDGWKVGNLSDVAHIVMGQSPTSNHYNDKKMGLPFHQGVTYFGDRYPEDVVYSTGGEKIAEENDILISVRAPVGRINIANQKMIIGRGLSAVRSKNNQQYFLLYLLKTLFHKEDLFGGGSVFPSITKGEFEKLKINVPSNNISILFDKKVSSFDLEIKNLIKENIFLKSQRDQLLAKLI